MKSVYMKLSLIGLMAGAVFVRPALAQQPVVSFRTDSLFAKHVHAKGALELGYRLFVPELDSATQLLPLVLFLHGAGERGDDNHSQLEWGVAEFVRPFFMARNKAIVLAPQCPAGERWSDVSWRAREHDTKAEATWPLAMAVGVVDSLIQSLPVDANRVYISGMSMGGYGTWDALARWPQKWAAAVPVCGGGDVGMVGRFAHVPVWAFHGARDGVVPVENSRAMIRALNRAGGSPRYTEYPYVDHFAWLPAYSTKEMHDWLFEQKRE